MKLIVRPNVFSAIPGLRVLVLSVTMPNDVPEERVLARNEAIRSRWTAAWSRVADAPRNGPHPHIATFRTALKAAGIKVSSYPPAIESLTKRIKPGTSPFSVNPLVDLYNSMCLENFLPAGAFDLDRVAAASNGGDILLRRSEVGDTFLALDDAETKDMAPGELAYFTGSVGLTRHFIWRQARQGLVHESSRRIVVVSEFVRGIDEQSCKEMERALVSAFRDICGADVRTGMLTTESNEEQVLV
ncbi:Phenylalanyl-tRNA synthetase [Hyaloraphidium curvatum]|nr:Phenylalanyl-tRNA synthetase [Hyaloraphidium curvatum]